jgi:hypothetical protein
MNRIKQMASYNINNGLLHDRLYILLKSCSKQENVFQVLKVIDETKSIKSGMPIL